MYKKYYEKNEISRTGNKSKDVIKTHTQKEITKKKSTVPQLWNNVNKCYNENCKRGMWIRIMNNNRKQWSKYYGKQKF